MVSKLTTAAKTYGVEVGATSWREIGAKKR